MPAPVFLGVLANVTFRDISVEYVGHNDPELKNLVAVKPHVDSRELPCWGMFGRNIGHLVLENITLSFTGTEYRSPFCFDNVAKVTFKNVKCKQSRNNEVVILQNSGEINGDPIILFE
jgi:hypothetical protein